MSLPTTWVTKEKQTLKIREMSTRHLENALRVLRRRGLLSPEEAEDEAAGCCGFTGEMASYYAEQMMDEAFNRSCPHISAFEAELERRRASLIFFKIRCKGTTDRFSSGGMTPVWTNPGKSWTNIGHVKSHLRIVNRRKPRKYQTNVADYDEAEIITFEANPVEAMDVNALLVQINAKDFSNA